jgi:hypothetical protein
MYVCEVCGKMHDEPSAICCGQLVTPLEKALGLQNQLFELTGNDRAQNVLQVLKSGYEGAAQNVTKAENKLVELRLMKEAAAETLLNFYKLSVESSALRD